VYLSVHIILHKFKKKKKQTIYSIFDDIIIIIIIVFIHYEKNTYFRMYGCVMRIGIH